MRRTLTVDAQRPSGLATGLRLVGRGRDLLTGLDGSSIIKAASEMTVDLRYEVGAVVQAISVTPTVDGVEALLGRIATSGFRACIDSLTGARRGSLEYALLDEIPVSTLVSGYAVGHSAAKGGMQHQELTRLRPPGPPLQVADLCAGFQTGGVIMTEMARSGRPPLVTGPPAPELRNRDDDLGWHPLDLLAPTEMRRWRRMDLWADQDGTFDLDGLFRDSHMSDGGEETIIHEYTVAARFDLALDLVTACEAEPRVLPWMECPQAAASAKRVAGMPISQLRRDVRDQFVGISTCTHLNDTLRQLGDVPTLAALLAD